MAGRHALPTSRRRTRFSLGLLAAAAMVASSLVPLLSATPASASPPVGITGYQMVQGPMTNVPHGTSVAAYALCPTGKVELSAGVTSHNPLAFLRIAAPTSRTDTWLVAVTNTASVDDWFRTWAVCVDASSVPGYHVVTGSPITVNSPGGASGTVYCPAGEYVVGGGVTNHNPASYVSVSRPTTDNRAWQAFVYNNATLSYSENFTINAGCIPQADVSSYAIKTATTGAYGTLLTQPINNSSALFNTADAPYCSTTQVAVAGGTTNHNQKLGFISSTRPTSDGRSWQVTSTITNPPGYTESSYPNVICVSGTAGSGTGSVTVKATDATMTYGGTVPALGFTVTGLASGDTLTTEPTCTSPGTTAGVGTYPITCSGADAGSGYSVSYVAGTLTVTPATLTITADNQTIAYGADDPTYTQQTTGLVGSDSLAGHEPSCGVAGAHTDAGTYAITCSGADPGPDYTVVYVPGTLTVTQGVVHIQAHSASIVHGDPDPAFGYTASGLVGTDALVTEPTCGVSGAHAHAGTYTITCSGADAGPNYTVDYADGTLTVTTAPGVITPDPQSITYGDAEPTFTYTVSGLSQSDLTTEPTCGVSGAHVHAGVYTITCSGADAGPDYTLDETATSTLTIAPKPATLTPDNQSITYGDADPTFTYATAGLINGDTLVTPPTCGVTGAHANAGNYSITCAGADAGSDYTLDQSATGTLTVSPKAAAVTPQDESKVYGADDPAFTYSVTGLINGDHLTTEPSCGVTGPHANVGTYEIACTGASAGGNYVVAQTATATLTVTQAALTVTAANATRPYGAANPAFSATVSGYVNGDNAATAYTGSPAVSTTATPTTDVGTYPITVSAGSLSSSNYTFVFVPGALTIVPAATTINELRVSVIRTLLTGKFTFKATLTSQVTGARVPGQTVEFSFATLHGGAGTTRCSATTDAGGVATCTSRLTLSSLLASLSGKSVATFGGSLNYLPSSITRNNTL